jgi:site-specific DNA recombinase
MIAATKKKTKPDLLPAVSYIRMSSDEQETSPAQQRAEVAKLAVKHGYNLIAEYIDEGISGAATTKRKDFLRMMNDAEKGKFKAILCWDQDRFGRFDSIEAGRWVHPLRERGISLVTVAQGIIDWSDFASRMIYSIHQEGKNQYLLDLSRNVCRGLLAKAQDGLVISRAPYGYDRLFFMDGKLMHRAHHDAKFKKPKDWTVKLDISEDTEAVAIVRWIFETFTATDCSVQWLSMELNRQGKTSATGKHWRYDAVGDIIQNPVYTGCYAFGRGRHGKFHQCAEGSTIVRGGKSRKGAPPIISIKDNHPALVDEATFEKAQAKLASRRMEKRRPSAKNYPLSGVLRCGHCGGPMTGSANRNNAQQMVRYYTCAKSVHGVCAFHRMNADSIERQMSEIVQDVLLGPSVEAALRQELTAAAKRRKTKSPVKATEAKARLARLEKQIKRGTENLLLIDGEDVPAAQKVLIEWRQERDRLKAQLDAQDAATPRLDGPVDVLVERAMEQMRELQERISSASPNKSREGFRQLFESITLFWHPREPGQRNYRLARIVIERRFPEGFCSVSAPSGPTGERHVAQW